MKNERMQLKYLFIFIFVLFNFHLNSQTLLNWQAQQELNSNLPEDIKIFKASGNINGDTLTAWYSTTDISSGEFVFFPVYSETNQKPEKYYSESDDDIIIMTNGGYFGTNVSYSLVLNDYYTLVPNILAVNRSYNNTNYLYYPTRSAFGISPGLIAQAEYVYTFSETNLTYAYPEPAPNSTSQLPLPQPSPDYPENGTLWNVSEAIGGGPMLIRDSIINTNYEPELFPNDITGSVAPRTAIGVTGKGEIINLVVDGRQDHSRGVTLQVLAEILLELGCVEAINLDGGGSSVISVNGEILNQPSDGNTRFIPSVVTIKKAVKVEIDDSRYLKLSQSPFDSIAADDRVSPKALLFHSGEIGKLIFPDLVPAKYRLEIFLNESPGVVLTDSLKIIVPTGEDKTDTVCINQQSAQKDQFINAGSWQLGDRDTLLISNESPGKTAQLGTIRLVKVASGLPGIDLIPAKYYDTHSFNETISFRIRAESINSSRKLTSFKVYEVINNHYTALKENQFSPANTYLDSIEYLVQTDPDQIQLLSVIYDELNDSSYVYYTINIDNTPPSLGIGKNSVLEGGPGDSLKFELRLLMANESRPLDKLRVYKNPSSENLLLAEMEPDPNGDTILFEYEILEEDIPRIDFRFIVEDIFGYSGSRDFSYFFSSVYKPSSDSFIIDFNRMSRILIIHPGEPFINKPGLVSIYDISGKIILSEKIQFAGNNTLNLPHLNSGIYLLRIMSGTEIFHLKFFN
jgi:hypothetical protein